MPMRDLRASILSFMAEEISLGISFRRLRIGLEDWRFSFRRVSPRREVFSWDVVSRMNVISGRGEGLL